MKPDTNTSGSEALDVVTASPEETDAVAEALGGLLTGGEVVALVGPLGAGKTRFAKGLAAGLGIDPAEVTSPTFLLIHELAGRLPLLHLDAYRIGGEEDLVELGAEEILDPAGPERGRPVAVVEWADRVPGLLPADRLDVELGHQGAERRSLAFRARGEAHGRLLARLRECLAAGEDGR